MKENNNSEKLAFVLVLIAIVGFIVYKIYDLVVNWNKPYEVFSVGAHGQFHPTGEFTTYASEFSKALIFVCIVVTIILIGIVVNFLEKHKNTK